MMARATLPLAVVEALQGAGATEEMIGAAAGAIDVVDGARSRHRGAIE